MSATAKNGTSLELAYAGFEIIDKMKREEHEIANQELDTRSPSDREWWVSDDIVAFNRRKTGKKIAQWKTENHRYGKRK